LHWVGAFDSEIVGKDENRDFFHLAVSKYHRGHRYFAIISQIPRISDPVLAPVIAIPLCDTLLLNFNELQHRSYQSYNKIRTQFSTYRIDSSSSSEAASLAQAQSVAIL